MTYYFGSSHGSRAKDEVLGRAVTGQVIRSLWDGMVKEARLVPYTVALVSFLSLVVAAFGGPASSRRQPRRPPSSIWCIASIGSS